METRTPDFNTAVGSASYSFYGRPDFARIIRENPSAHEILLSSGPYNGMLVRCTESALKAAGVTDFDISKRANYTYSLGSGVCCFLRNCGENDDLPTGWLWVILGAAGTGREADYRKLAESLKEYRNRPQTRVTVLG